MVAVTWWEEMSSGPWGDRLYQGYAPDAGLQLDANGNPREGMWVVNATGWSYAEMQSLIMDAWNREMQASLTLADFEWIGP